MCTRTRSNCAWHLDLLGQLTTFRLYGFDCPIQTYKSLAVLHALQPTKCWQSFKPAIRGGYRVNSLHGCKGSCQMSWARAAREDPTQGRIYPDHANAFP